MKIISKIFIFTVILCNVTSVYAHFNTVRKDDCNYRILPENNSGNPELIIGSVEKTVSENKDSIDVTGRL